MLDTNNWDTSQPALVIACKLLRNAAELGARDPKYRSFSASNARIAQDCLSAGKVQDLLQLGGFRRHGATAGGAGACWRFLEHGDARRARALVARCAPPLGTTRLPL